MTGEIRPPPHALVKDNLIPTSVLSRSSKNSRFKTPVLWQIVTLSEVIVPLTPSAIGMRVGKQDMPKLVPENGEDRRRRCHIRVGMQQSLQRCM
jgi:hypothetical protein